MKKTLNLYKNIGETPLQCLERFREDNPEYKDISLSYAGRLDPMAEGVLLVLVGEENKEREKYLSLDKEYVAEILFGFKTDTYDILGLNHLTQTDDRPNILFEQNVLRKRLREALKAFQGKRLQAYPPYSSKPVLGQPLFSWARSNTLDKIQIPSREIEIHSIVLQNYRMISREELEGLIHKRISLVKGDFRQKEILKMWDTTLDEIQGEKFPVAKIFVQCSSGTYVRSLAHSLGEILKTGALALSIKRTKVGKWNIKDSVRFKKQNP